MQALHCVGRLDSNIFELPSGFSVLSSLTRLTLEEVRAFSRSHPTEMCIECVDRTIAAAQHWKPALLSPGHCAPVLLLFCSSSSAVNGVWKTCMRHVHRGMAKRTAWCRHCKWQMSVRLPCRCTLRTGMRLMAVYQHYPSCTSSVAPVLSLCGVWGACVHVQSSCLMGCGGCGGLKL